MKNQINSAIGDLDIATIDELLPFENKTVWIWDIRHNRTGYGNWNLLLDIEIDGTREILKAHSTDSLMIDYWNGMDGQEHGFLDSGYIGYVDAIETILRTNLCELEELA